MGIYLSQPDKEKETIEDSFQNFKFVASSMQGWRTTMEDSHIMSKDLGDGIMVFGVFDGHGGKEVAKFVEKHFIEELKKNKNFQAKNFKDALYENFIRMDEMLETPEGQEELLKIKGTDYGESTAGCTANVILIHNKQIYCANAGDSRSILCRNGKELELSHDHKPENQKEKQRVEDAGGYVGVDGRINGNLNLSRAMGDLEYKNNKNLKVDEQLIIACPDIEVFELTDEDEFILMGCDGIWETKSNQELLDQIKSDFKKNIPMKEVIETLLDSLLAPDTNNGYGCDNMTAIIIKLK